MASTPLQRVFGSEGEAMPGEYRLPRGVEDRLSTALSGRKNAAAAMALAVFLGRYHSAPGRLVRPFPVDRIALADHQHLGLTEARVRGALAALEAIGFVERVEAPGSAYKATEHGLQRKPVQWRFGADWMPAFTAANARAQAKRGTPAPGRQPLPRPDGQGVLKSEETPLPRLGDRYGKLAHRSQPPVSVPVPGGANRPTQLARKDIPAGAYLSSGEMNRGEPNPALEAALARLGRAIGGGMA
jgi:hypothetical protein